MPHSDATREVLPGGYWLTPVLFDELVPARPSGGHTCWEVPANEPPEFPLGAPGETPPAPPQEDPQRTPLEVPPLPRARTFRARA
ncbi:MAG: hypothetical protein JSR36_05195 [Proteobacteria bacterium]|nr:hypothetical protein [Pseudomonadota bacterium]